MALIDGAFLASASGDFMMILCTDEAEEALRMSNSYLTIYHITSSLIKICSLGLSYIYQFFMEPNLLQEFLGFAGHDSALDAKIRTLGTRLPLELINLGIKLMR